MFCVGNFKKSTLAASLVAAMVASPMVSAAPGGAANNGYDLKGSCAFLPADRMTEVHGNAEDAALRLALAGNQWVVMDAVMQGYNVYRGVGDGTEPSHHANPFYTLAELQDENRGYYMQMMPPGQLRKQIKSGCMVLGNDEERNFMTGYLKVDFDVFASTNYNLMKDLAKNGFVTEAVPYIKNKLDLMVYQGNPANIGADSYTGDADFDKQFDIIMDLLDSNVVASSLDHINEGIHNASNKYMGAAHDYIRANDRNVTIGGETKLATQWIQNALKAVATPQAGSPSEWRLASRDAGENHTSHDLSANACVYSGDTTYSPEPTYKFCEYAVLNKANTHESRVHHVETPNGVQKKWGSASEQADAASYVGVDVGFVWITELAYVLKQNGGSAGAPPTYAPVQGMVGQQDLSNLGIPSPDGVVNSPATYSLAVLATAKDPAAAQDWINFVRSSAGQTAYTQGGFQGLTGPELDKGKCYSLVSGVFNEWDRVNGSCAP